MKLEAQTNYSGDKDTRFGDCILLYDSESLIVYDCGHKQHSEKIREFLQRESSITNVHIVVSHNDSDHTSGITGLLAWLAEKDKYIVNVYTHQYLKHVDTILDKVADKRRNHESLKESLLAEFDNIKTIIETAQKYDFSAIEALSETNIGDVGMIVGPTIDEFTDVAAQAIDSRESNTIGEGQAEETVMNAASVQLKCSLDNEESVLLSGDASSDYLHNLDDYDIIQLPHHGQLDSAEAIFARLTNAGKVIFLISDNTGSSSTSGGSDNLMQSDVRKGKRIKTTKNGVVELPEVSQYNGGNSKTQGGIITPSTQKTGGYGYDIL